jgi:hypothetical protein
MADALAGGERMLHDRSSAHGRATAGGDASELMRKIAANPRRPPSWSKSSNADRAWNDNGARKQLLQFFDTWGLVDPATVAERRKLSVPPFS